MPYGVADPLAELEHLKRDVHLRDLPRAGRLSMRSALSLPLLVDGSVIGAFNVYGRRFNSFDEVSVGESFAQPAAVTAAMGGSSP